MLQFVILGFLMSHDMSGYDIKKKMSLSTVNFVDASFGSIYPALKRLKQKGHITYEEIVENGKNKKIYSVTPEGKNEFLNWIEIPINPQLTKFDQMVKIFFYNHIAKEKAIYLIEKYICDLRSLKDKLEGTKDIVSQKADYFEMSVFKVGNGYYDFLIKWYEKFLAELKEKNDN